jgi:hypothetical protein
MTPQGSDDMIGDSFTEGGRVRQQMNRRQMVKLGAACTVAMALIGIAFALFYGYFDHGQYTIKQEAWSSGLVAMVAERSDHEALSGDVYFVVIGDHIFTPSELRTAYYRHQAIFAADSNCLGVRWSGPRKLTVMCRDGFIESDHVDVQRHEAKGIAITYLNIPDIATAR